MGLLKDYLKENICQLW